MATVPALSSYCLVTGLSLSGAYLGTGVVLSNIMGVRQKAAETPDDEEQYGIESLIEDPEPKTLSERKSGSLAGTIPQILSSNANIDSETAIQYLAHSGQHPVVIDEPCLIIRHHPHALSYDE